MPDCPLLSRVQALSCLTAVEPLVEKASMPSASVSVGKTRMEVAQRSLMKMSTIEWSMKMFSFRSVPRFWNSGRVQV